MMFGKDLFVERVEGLKSSPCPSVKVESVFSTCSRDCKGINKAKWDLIFPSLFYTAAST